MLFTLAIDIGASSGRHIVGWMENGDIRTNEVYRFPNGVIEANGHLTWDVDALEHHVRTGIEEALKEFPQFESLSIDTGGVDYVLIPAAPWKESPWRRTHRIFPPVPGRCWV